MFFSWNYSKLILFTWRVYINSYKYLLSVPSYIWNIGQMFMLPNECLHPALIHADGQFSVLLFSYFQARCTCCIRILLMFWLIIWVMLFSFFLTCRPIVSSVYWFAGAGSYHSWQQLCRPTWPNQGLIRNTHASS